MTADKGAARLRYSFMPHVNGGLQIRRGKDIVGAIEPRPARGLPPYVLLSQGDVVARFASIGAAKRYVLQEWAGIAVGTPVGTLRDYYQRALDLLRENGR